MCVSFSRRLPHISGSTDSILYALESPVHCQCAGQIGDFVNLPIIN